MQCTQRPTVAELRALAMACTIRPHAGQPASVGQCQLLVNAAGWAPGWRAAAIYERPAPRAPGSPRLLRAELVLVEGGTRGKPAQWYTATLAEWPAE
jgi:hypothetical protein